MDDVRTTTPSRRELLTWFSGLGAAVVLAACGGDGGSTASSSTTRARSSTSGGTPATTAAGAATVATCEQIPEETEGPFPGDGTNGPNILTEDGVVRSDITRSIGAASGVAEGVPLTMELTIVDRERCGPRPGTAIYVWHCDRAGDYSMYSLPDENYLRGVQVADADGRVTFRSIFPAAYQGRWPHVHFELFDSVERATNGRNRIAVSQMALPKDVCDSVYATDGYERSVQNMKSLSIDTDMVFADGHELQDPTMGGRVDGGYTAALTIGV
jgi:protocatechuate 3,4-dioxygenase beta subunit